MKKCLYIVLATLLMAACQPDHYRTVYPAGQPEMKATMLTQTVLYGTDSVAFDVEINEKETPLSQLQVKVMVGLQVVATDMLRTPDFHYAAQLRYAVPFGPNMPEGEEVKVYLTATNVEGTATNVILTARHGNDVRHAAYRSVSLYR